MLESLTDSRHSLAATTTTSLNTLNTKLEFNVSHIPYIAPSKQTKRHLRRYRLHRLRPHRALPQGHRNPNHPSLKPQQLLQQLPNSHQTPPPPKPTRLTSLHTSLQSLLSLATTSSFSTPKALSTSLSSFQSTIDKLSTSESNYDFTSSTYSFQNPTASKTKAGEGDSQAVKFKQEIRALKGAFLSSRNFPTVRAAVPFTLPPQQR